MLPSDAPPGSVRDSFDNYWGNQSMFTYRLRGACDVAAGPAAVGSPLFFVGIQFGWRKLCVWCNCVVPL